jgi:hypothetical protein
MPNPIHTRRFFRPTTAWLIYSLLVVEGLLWLSERSFPKGWAVLIAVAAVGAAMLVMLAWFVVSLVFRLRFQFSIRSMLVLTVAVAVACSWLGVEMRAAREKRAAVEAINKFGGLACYGIPCGLSDQYMPPDSGWLNDLLGDEIGWVCFYNNTTVTDGALENLKGLKHVQGLILSGTQVTDVGLEHLEGLKQLEFLDLSGTKVTDAGLDHLRGLEQLSSLGIINTKATYQGAAKALPNCWIDR